MKLGDKVKTSTQDPLFDSLIGHIVVIDEGLNGIGSVKVSFDKLSQYNPITDKINEFTDVEIRFNLEELKVIK